MTEGIAGLSAYFLLRLWLPEPEMGTETLHQASSLERGVPAGQGSSHCPRASGARAPPPPDLLACLLGAGW